jgi:hypothetical protein
MGVGQLLAKNYNPESRHKDFNKHGWLERHQRFFING